MKLKSAVLGSASLGLAAIGLGYLIAPDAVLSLYGVSIQSVSEANILRSACGGIFLAFAVLFGVGSYSPNYGRPALLALLAFMGGLAFGRAVSFVADGIPHVVLVAVFVVEIIYSCASLFLLCKEEPRA